MSLYIRHGELYALKAKQHTKERIQLFPMVVTILIGIILALVLVLWVKTPISDQVALTEFRNETGTSAVTIVSVDHNFFDSGDGDSDVATYIMRINGNIRNGTCRKAGLRPPPECSLSP
jgi:hypothetical protein